MSFVRGGYRPPATSTSCDWDAAGREAANAAALEALAQSIHGVFGEMHLTPGPWMHEGVRVTAMLVEGAPASVLCSAGQEADLLVVGARGRSRVGALLLGSVSRRVVATPPARCWWSPGSAPSRSPVLPEDVTAEAAATEAAARAAASI